MAINTAKQGTGVWTVFERRGNVFALELVRVGNTVVNRHVAAFMGRAESPNDPTRLIAEGVKAETETEAIKIATGDVEAASAKKPARKSAAKKPRGKKSAATEPAADVDAETTEEAIELAAADVDADADDDEETSEQFLGTDGEI